ncbi:MAG: hypothetical protein E6733_09975 [Streptococcus parasanguinis]|uniref:hypothetical protein n=1 Tax=Leclercia adecarboxylata TaxID=83655 RepID=UPI00098142D0|nr:hypothetical protein [Leclercia adecarboxylata]MDU1985423.1 hypothetical protein [Streptococcus parasanguinis]OOB84550.1 hypothetical protein BZY71_24215 [Leclercia adecarboxylata]
MFFRCVKQGWDAGKVRVGLPAGNSSGTSGIATTVSIEGKGLLGFMALFLSRKERQALAELSKSDALAVKASSQ